MKLRVTVAHLLLPPMLALGATAGALAADSPFAVFKKIVMLSESEREAAVGKLKISSERHRKLVQAKVREYAAMPESERDRKLDALDFRWHLMPIMKTPKTDRAKQLASVPERLRTDIERRLIGWDKLEAGVRADLLKNESFFRYLSSFGRGPPVARCTDESHGKNADPPARGGSRGASRPGVGNRNRIAAG